MARAINSVLAAMREGSTAPEGSAPVPPAADSPLATPRKDLIVARILIAPPLPEEKS